jgi:hypothetical protein
MITLASLVVASLVTLFDGQPAAAAPAPACTLLTAQEVASIIGTARPITVSNSATGSACMFQNEDRIVTVLMAKLDSAATAKHQWETKKRIVSGQDLAGWPTSAYSATINTAKDHGAAVGVVAGQTFAEAKANDKAQSAADVTAKLQAVMKAVSSRLAAQK